MKWVEKLRPYSDRVAALLAEDRAAAASLALSRLRAVATRLGAQRTLDVAALEDIGSNAGEAQLRPSAAGLASVSRRASAQSAHSRGGGIAVVGESVARGFLLEPRVTLSSCIERVTGSYGNVTDLSVNDLTLKELQASMGLLKAIRPEIIVLYAGNNWVLSRPGLAELDAMSLLLRTGGWGAVAQYRTRRIAAAARSCLDELNSVARRVGARLIVVVPGRSDAWDFDATPWGRRTEMSCPGEIDAVVTGLPLSGVPHCPDVFQDLLKESAAAHGWDVLDCDSLLAPGSYLDYCHLGVRGLTRIAEAIGHLTGLSSATADDSSELEDAEAVGHLLAALHCSIYGQPPTLILDHVRGASPSPLARDLAAAVFQVGSETTPIWISQAGRRLLADVQVSSYLALARAERGESVVGPQVLWALAAAGLANPEARDRGRIDMLAMYRRRAATRQIELSGNDGPLMAVTPRTGLQFFSARPRTWQLQLDLRPSAGGPIAVEANGEVIYSTETYAGTSLGVVAHVQAVPGMNGVTVQWAAAPLGDEGDCTRMLSGAFPHVVTRYGDVAVAQAICKD